MSLVNKMLRDLDARRAGNGDRAALPAAVTPLAARQEPSRARTPVLLAAVLLLVALGAWYAGSEQSAAPAVVAVAAVAAAPAVADPVAPAATLISVAPAPPPKKAPAPVALSSLRMADALSAAPAMPAKPEPKAPAIAAKSPQPSPQAVAAAATARPALKEPPEPVESRIDKQVRLPSAVERAEADYRRGLLAQRQGNADGAA
ncbi:MAG: hypothetical protein Q8S20_03670, partial [Sulfuritalea sp.]|nr:hypothetical protein [Sulfuritalea sp.]